MSKPARISLGRHAANCFTALFVAVVLSACSHEALFDGYMKEGNEALDKPNWTLAVDKYRLAIKEAAFLKPKDPRRLKAQMGLCRAQAGLSKPEDTLSALAKAADVAASLNDVEGQARIELMSAQEWLKLKDEDESFTHLTKALDILSDANLDDTILGADVKSTIGGIFNARGKFDKAIPFLEDARRVLEKDPAGAHSLAGVLHALAFSYRSKGKDDQANDLDERAKRMEMTGIDDQISKLRVYK